MAPLWGLAFYPPPLPNGPTVHETFRPARGRSAPLKKTVTLNSLHTEMWTEWGRRAGGVVEGGGYIHRHLKSGGSTFQYRITSYKSTRTRRLRASKKRPVTHTYNSHTQTYSLHRHMDVALFALHPWGSHCVRFHTHANHAHRNPEWVDSHPTPLPAQGECEKNHSTHELSRHPTGAVCGHRSG